MEIIMYLPDGNVIYLFRAMILKGHEEMLKKVNICFIF